jgi:hypothetical protein
MVLLKHETAAASTYKPAWMAEVIPIPKTTKSGRLWSPIKILMRTFLDSPLNPYISKY